MALCPMKCVCLTCQRSQQVWHFMVQCLSMHCSTRGWPLRKQCAQRLCKGLPTTTKKHTVMYSLWYHVCIFLLSNKQFSSSSSSLSSSDNAAIWFTFQSWVQSKGHSMCKNWWFDNFYFGIFGCRYGRYLLPWAAAHPTYLFLLNNA